VVLCEGYDDRAFWKGWLCHLRCTDALESSGGPLVLDPWNRRVSGGQYAFYSASGSFIRVVPCKGKEQVLRQTRTRLDERNTRDLVHLVVNLDADEDASSDRDHTATLRQRVIGLLDSRQSPYEPDHGGNLLLDDGATMVSTVCWHASDPPDPELPDKQTLERLVCSAIISAYPERGPAH